MGTQNWTKTTENWTPTSPIMFGYVWHGLSSDCRCQTLEAHLTEWFHMPGRQAMCPEWLMQVDCRSWLGIWRPSTTILLSSDARDIETGCSSVEGKRSWYGWFIYMGYLIATCETKSLRAFQTVEDSIQTGHVYFSASKLTPHWPGMWVLVAGSELM